MSRFVFCSKQSLDWGQLISSSFIGRNRREMLFRAQTIKLKINFLHPKRDSVAQLKMTKRSKAEDTTETICDGCKISFKVLFWECSAGAHEKLNKIGFLPALLLVRLCFDNKMLGEAERTICTKETTLRA